MNVPFQRAAIAVLGFLALGSLCACQGSQVSLAVAPFPRSHPATTPSPGQTIMPSPGPSVTASPNAGGLVTISVPSPSPVLCSPSPLTIAVYAVAILTCAAQGYGGPIGFEVAEPSIASVVLAPGFSSTFFVTGLSAGTTTLNLNYAQGGGSGSVAIAVTP